MPFRKKCKPQKVRLAQKMRNHPTRAERLLWDEFLKRPQGIKFRRQEIILGWIADFYCTSKRLIIEIDGEYHDSPEQRASDARRDRVMAEHGIATLRFKNEDVLRNTAKVLEQILQHRPANVSRKQKAA